jgi:LmbE family N-acetylglucosaminyl deacetylase
VLAVGAHPDDAEYFAGGTLLRLREAGASVALVVCTDGGRGGRGLADPVATRRAEQERAAATLGAEPWIGLGHPDGELTAGEPLRAELVHEIRRLRPELVLTHDPRTAWTVVDGLAQPGHSDHRAAGQALLDAVYPRAPSPNFYPWQLAGGWPGGGVSLWYPREVWLFDTDRPDLRVDVGDTFARKIDLLRKHSSQDAAGGLVDQARRLAAHLGSPERPAEGFARLRLY